MAQCIHEKNFKWIYLYCDMGEKFSLKQLCHNNTHNIDENILFYFLFTGSYSNTTHINTSSENLYI